MIYGTNQIINHFYIWHYIYGWIEAVQHSSANTDFNLSSEPLDLQHDNHAYQ
jgi:hypothetical protein